MIRIISLLLVMLLPAVSQAVDTLSIDLEQITFEDWKLEDIQLTLSDINEAPQNLKLLINKLSFPEPFDVLSFADITCPVFKLEADSIACQRGKAKLKSPLLDSSAVDFNFLYENQKTRLTLNNLKIAGGLVSLVGMLDKGRWLIKLDARNVECKRLLELLNLDNIDLTGGKVSIRASASGMEADLRKLNFIVSTKELTVQTRDGLYASEGVKANLEVNASKKKGGWQWDSQLVFNEGAVYADPVFIEVSDQAITLKTKGSWRQKDNRIDMKTVSLIHPGIGSIKGWLQLKEIETMTLENAKLSIKTDDLQAMTSTYLQPFFEATAMEGIGFSGRLQGRFEYVQQTLTEVGLTFNKLEVTDNASRFMLKDGSGYVNWSNRKEKNSQTRVAWNQLEVFNLPFGQANLSLTTDASSIRLNRAVNIPALGGNINIKRFGWQTDEGQEPDVHFEGAVQNVSLENLSEALDWKPLAGSITGNIPGVTYRKGRLEINGELEAKVFDGDIRITKLASSGLFSDLPQFYADMEIENLDLQQVTQAFEFGGIEGRLSGYVRDLYMEDWQPVTFYAWLGTPEDDDSRHRISQKAVENLASVGGGGAAGLLSRSFLGFFDTFGYDSLGIGCYLYNGVCQLMGVEPAKKGYYIVKGGGLPRIDVIGYNPQVDWNVLIERLARVTGTDEAVIE